MFTKKHLQNFENKTTPFYYYDLGLLNRTLQAVTLETEKYGYHLHYALKANANPTILKIIKNAGLGADCVSGNELKCAIDNGFSSNQIVFAGVGKTDEEIIYGIKNDVLCFNCESVQELEVVNSLSGKFNKITNVALRINPGVNADTHQYITTGNEENKFGIGLHEFDLAAEIINKSTYLNFSGLHFHIGSQIKSLAPFKNLCVRINEIQKWFTEKGFQIDTINVGGGLGVNYIQPDEESIPEFKSYFKIFNDFLEIEKRQRVHFELGRSIVAQCGSLISRVLYIKKGLNTIFAIIDAGMTELIRPALYQAYHKIENISKQNEGWNSEKYDVVGPICETSDCFGKSIILSITERDDLIAIRTTGAYGETMSSSYNLRNKNENVYF